MTTYLNEPTQRVRTAQALPGVQEGRNTRHYSVHLIGGAPLHMRLEADDLGEVAEQLSRARSLIGELVFEHDGIIQSVFALIPANRVQLITEEH